MIVIVHSKFVANFIQLYLSNQYPFIGQKGEILYQKSQNKVHICSYFQFVRQIQLKAQLDTASYTAHRISPQM